jgi:hypothetical protein
MGGFRVGDPLWGVGGDEGIRTPGLYVANVPLSQLSYTPTLQRIRLYGANITSILP